MYSTCCYGTVCLPVRLYPISEEDYGKCIGITNTGVNGNALTRVSVKFICVTLMLSTVHNNLPTALVVVMNFELIRYEPHLRPY